MQNTRPELSADSQRTNIKELSITSLPAECSDKNTQEQPPIVEKELKEKL